MGMIRWGSSCTLIIPHSDRWDFEFMQEEYMHVKAGTDPLIKIKKLSQTKKFYVLPDTTGLMRNVKDNLNKGKRITIEEGLLIPKFLIEEKEGIKIFEVDGNYIRKEVYDDFTMGGHEYVYPNFIPHNEIWLDKDLSTEDKEATLIHEANERLKMSKGIMYSEAHIDSNKKQKIIYKSNPVVDSDDNIEIPAEFAYLFKNGNEETKKKIKDHLKKGNK
jgi:hypothetical protein